MSDTQAGFDQVLARIDSATNSIADELKALKGEIVGGGLPADAEASILGKLDAAAAKLEGLGKPSDGTSSTPIEEPADQTQPETEQAPA